MNDKEFDQFLRTFDEEIGIPYENMRHVLDNPNTIEGYFWGNIVKESIISFAINWNARIEAAAANEDECF